jgi:hypothetical protein
MASSLTVTGPNDFKCFKIEYCPTVNPLGAKLSSYIFVIADDALRKFRQLQIRVGQPGPFSPCSGCGGAFILSISILRVIVIRASRFVYIHHYTLKVTFVNIFSLLYRRAFEFSINANR